MNIHYKNNRFKGDVDALTMTAKDWVISSWRFLFEKNHQVPDEPLPVRPADLSAFNDRAKKQLTSTWLGHSSLMINMDGYRILTDPVFENKLTLMGPARFNKEFPLDLKELKGIDLVLISHDHYDHLSKSSIQVLTPLTKRFIVPLAVGKRLVAWGVPEDKIVELDWWKSHPFDSGLTITATPARHFSGRGIGDRNSTLWASYVISSPGFRVFYSGDSGYFPGFREIGEKFGPFDVTFLECGAYNELWHFVHMFPEETVKAHQDLKGRVLHPIHWGTFNLSLHPWFDPMQRLARAAQQYNIEIATPMAGETLVFGNGHLGSSWWEEKSGQGDTL
jgi:L-ascorbate metabolism protein UlaG (beta-lactamase superfamily)